MNGPELAHRRALDSAFEQIGHRDEAVTRCARRARLGLITYALAVNAEKCLGERDVSEVLQLHSWHKRPLRKKAEPPKGFRLHAAGLWPRQDWFPASHHSARPGESGDWAAPNLLLIGMTEDSQGDLGTERQNHKNACAGVEIDRCWTLERVQNFEPENADRISVRRLT